MVISTNMTTTTTNNATTSTSTNNSNSSSVTPSASSTTGTGSTSSSTTKLLPPPLKKRHYNETMSLKNQVAVDTETSLLSPAQHDEDAAASAQSVGQVQVPPLQPITADGIRPQKRFYRQRAHCNPLAHNDSYDYPITPFHMDWTKTSNLYPVTMNDDRSKEQLSSLPPPLPPPPPSSPSSQLIPHQPTVLDIGCGFGGLTLALASIVPHENICGMEIRAKVTEYVRLRIVAARLEQTYSINPHAMETSIPPAPPPKTTTATNTTVSDVTSPSFGKRHHYNNCGVIRTNSMKYLPNYFLPHTISKLFFCFPDPHFKRKNFPRRIVSYRLLDEYAYLLVRQRPKCDHDDTSTNQNRGGMLYAITDVKELHEWHVQACQTHPLFEPVLMSESSISNNNNDDNNDNDDDTDPFIHAMKYLTEEGQKVDRNHGSKYYIMYECRHWPDLTQPPTVHAGNFFQS